MLQKDIDIYQFSTIIFNTHCTKEAVMGFWLLQINGANKELNYCYNKYTITGWVASLRSRAKDIVSAQNTLHNSISKKNEWYWHDLFNEWRWRNSNRMSIFYAKNNDTSMAHRCILNSRCSLSTRYSIVYD